MNPFIQWWTTKNYSADSSRNITNGEAVLGLLSIAIAIAILFVLLS